MIATERVTRRRTARPAFAETRLRASERTGRHDAVEAAVRGRLREAFGPNGDRVEVTVAAGRVLLGGRVASYFAKQRAGHAALSACDGLLVQNDLHVAPRPAQT